MDLVLLDLVHDLRRHGVSGLVVQSNLLLVWSWSESSSASVLLFSCLLVCLCFFFSLLFRSATAAGDASGPGLSRPSVA